MLRIVEMKICRTGGPVSLTLHQVLSSWSFSKCLTLQKSRTSSSSCRELKNFLAAFQMPWCGAIGQRQAGTGLGRVGLPVRDRVSGSSQCTSPKHPVSCIKPRLVIHFLHDSIHVALNFKCNYLFNYRNSVCFQTYIIVFSRLIFTHIVSLKSTCLTSCSHNIKILSFYRAHSTVFCFCCGSHSWTFSIFTVIALMGWHFLEL